MLWFIAIVVLATLTACQFGAAPTPTLEPTIAPTPERVVEVSIDGVTLALSTPRGWQSVPNDFGILVAEHTDLNNSRSSDGILVYVFVQAIGELELGSEPEGNAAYRLLSYVTRQPDASLGDSTISPTVPFRLGMSEAAYYLLSDSHGYRTLVLAMHGGEDKVVVCNVSAPHQDSERIRTVLPMMLANLTIDGSPVDMDGLEMLPDPLHFPEHRRRAHPYAEATAPPQPDSTPDS